jgi:hypothetical protein
MAMAHRWEIQPDKIIHILLNFYPAKNYGYDRDGLQSRMKSALDGLADGWGVNDKFFKPVSDIHKKDGRARVEVTAWQD